MPPLEQAQRADVRSPSATMPVSEFRLARLSAVSELPIPLPTVGSGTPASTAGKPGVAAFDVDGTLTTRDCVVPFLRAINASAPTAIGMARHPRRLATALLRRDRDTIKALAAVVVFRGRPIDAVEALGRRFADQVAATWIRPETLAALRAHQASGHDVVLVSASFAVYVRPLGEHLGVADVLGTELVVDGAGWCTGALDGGNCRGEEKVVRLHAWLAKRYGARTDVQLWAYGDSAGDYAMLADADHAVWMGAARKRPPGVT